MKTNQIEKIANAIKPPANKTEMIEALATRKLQKLTEEHEALRKEKQELDKKTEVLAAECIAENGRMATKTDVWGGRVYRVDTDKNSNGALTIRVTATMVATASDDLRKHVIRLRAIEANPVYHTVPSLYEIKNQIRAAINQHTPQKERVKTLLSDEITSNLIDSMLARLDSTKTLAITV